MRPTSFSADGGDFRRTEDTYLDLVPLAVNQSSSATYTAFPHEATDKIEISVLVRRYWLLLVALILLGVAAAVVSIIYESPVYRARLMLEIQGINEAWLKNSLDSSSSFNSDDINIQTQIQLLRGGPFLRRVYDRLQSETVPLAPIGTDIFSRLRQRVRSSMQDPMQYVRQGVAVAFESFEARPINRTRLVELMCESTSPEIASQFLNTMANEFIEETLRSRLQNSQKTTEWLSAQIEETRTKLQETEQRLQEFVVSSGNLFVNQDATLDDAKLIQLRAELSRIQAERIAKQTKYELMKKTPLEQLPQLLDDGVIRSYQQKLAELRRERAVLETSYTSEHPKVRRVDAQMETVLSALQSELAGVANRISSDYEAALRVEKTLAAAYATQSQRVTSVAGKASQHNALKREVETLRQMYQSLLLQANQSGLANSVPINPIRLVEASIPPREPYRPRPALNISFGVIAAVALTIGTVFLRERSDRSVKAPGLSRTLFNTPELGVIPSAKSAQNGQGILQRWCGNGRSAQSLLKLQRDNREVSFWQGETSILAESFRGTLASLMRGLADGYSPQVILVTSSGPGEGKTLVAANLGIALAETGRRVLLVDADFRCPRLHNVFQVSNERSLADLITEDTAVADYPPELLGLSTAIASLLLLPNRPTRSNLSRLLYSPRLPMIIERLRQLVDMIVIDAPPILNLADARIIGRLADGVILVLRAGKTDRARAMEAYERIREDGLKLFGTVLNDWTPSKSQKKRYYYSYSDSEKA